MSKQCYIITCPNCSNDFEVVVIELQTPKTLWTYCNHCYYPVDFFPSEKCAQIRQFEIAKKAFLIHSSGGGEKRMLAWFRVILRLYGLETTIIESDPRSVDWLQKSLDGIQAADFVIAFLTKRYQYLDESGKSSGGKAPDKCYDEIAISFALQKKICALVEVEVDPGNVLKTRAWCYDFQRRAKGEFPAPIIAPIDFFGQLCSLIGWSTLDYSYS